MSTNNPDSNFVKVDDHLNILKIIVIFAFIVAECLSRLCLLFFKVRKYKDIKDDKKTYEFSEFQYPRNSSVVIKVELDPIKSNCRGSRSSRSRSMNLLMLLWPYRFSRPWWRCIFCFHHDILTECQECFCQITMNPKYSEPPNPSQLRIS